MSKYAELFQYLRQCPILADLWSIGATEDAGVKVILPQSSSQSKRYNEKIDVTDAYSCEIIPYPSIYEDYQINCYSYYDASDSSEPAININVLSLDEVQSICDWITEQSENSNYPELTGLKVVDISCEPNMPQIRYINPDENIIGYFITVRIRYVNPNLRRRYIEYDDLH